MLHTMGSDETAAALVGMLHTMISFARLVKSTNADEELGMLRSSCLMNTHARPLSTTE